MEEAAFYGFGALTLLGALLMVTAKNPLSGVLWLVVCFLGLSGLFGALGAHFLAAVQVLVYAGAILVLFLFVIMLLNLRPDDVTRMPALTVHGGVGGFVVGVLGFVAVTGAVVMGTTGREKIMAGVNPDLDGGAAALAIPLFSRFLLPFEAVSLLLLAAIVGAVALTKRRLP